MSDSAPVITLSVDIGNTRTHIAAVDADKLQCVYRIDSYNDDFDGAFAANIRKIADARPQIRRVNITSCVKSLAAKAKDICTGLCINPGEKLFDAVELVRPHNNLPVVFTYEDPNALGTDRVCDALACAALFKGKSCVIIDAGTAVTVDYLRDGRIFEGMAILSGYALQLEALHAKTDGLPLIDFGGFGGETAVSLPSKSTADCIKAGILYGMAGAIDRCVGVCKRSRGKGIIVATGGGWEPIKPLIKHTAVTIPDLTLLGAGVYRRE